MKRLINEIDKLESIKQSIRLIKGNELLVENLLNMINPIITEKEDLIAEIQSIKDGQQNLIEEEALQIHNRENKNV